MLKYLEPKEQTVYRLIMDEVDQQWPQIPLLFTFYKFVTPTVYPN